MATKRMEERLDGASIERVIEMLNPSKEGVKPATKKDCCAALGIAYNTTRLGQIIDKYLETKAKTEERRAKLRGKPASEEEIRYIVAEYLEGKGMEEIAKNIYRSSSLVKGVLDRCSVPIRASGYSYFTPPLLPEGATRERFKVGEKVYSARYDSLALVEVEYSKPEGFIYRIWLVDEKWKQYAYTEAYELASLDHLRELGVRI